MPTISYEIYVSRNFDGNFDLDAKIEEIVGVDATGSGAGEGSRDMDFELDGPMTESQVKELKAKLEASCGVEFGVLYEEWDADDEEPDGPLLGYYA